MKEIPFYLFILVAILYSCSNDDNGLIPLIPDNEKEQKETPEPTPTIYTVGNILLIQHRLQYPTQ